MTRDRGSAEFGVAAGLVVIVAAALVVLFTFLALDTGPHLVQGKVVDKTYDDEDEWYQPGYTIDGGQNCTGTYPNQVCTQNADIQVPGVWHTDPERYLLKLQGPDPDDADKTIEDTVEVPDWFYEKVKVGQWVDVDSLEVIPR